MKRCENCGKELDSTANYCPNCGKKIMISQSSTDKEDNCNHCINEAG
ncbi:MAG: zinc-ribbon domain-containing protein, partial [Bulleidia sp.]